MIDFKMCSVYIYVRASIPVSWYPVVLEYIAEGESSIHDNDVKVIISLFNKERFLRKAKGVRILLLQWMIE